MVSSFKRPFNFSIAIPASLTLDVPHLREKTFRIGLIGRAAAIFRVNEVIIYPDMPKIDQKLDTKLIQTILSYMETPQYLRKRLFGIMPELKYAGVLPPLRTPHHPTANKIEDLILDEYREGVVVSSSKHGSFIDIGVERPALVQGTMLKINSRLTVEITDVGKHLKAVAVDPREIKTYWGYQVHVSNIPLAQLLKKRQFDLVIATSKRGNPITSVLSELRERLRESRNVHVAFGAPTQGLFEIAAHEYTELEEATHFVVNTIPNQATTTVRTEEAVYATLSILNTLNK